jgi:hypothetical protein
MSGLNPDFLKGKKSIDKGGGVVRPFLCPFRPETNGTERLVQNRPASWVVGFVGAARFLGGQLLAGSRTKQNSNLPQYRRACIQ